MTRDQLLAAEIFSYSFNHYAGHLGIRHTAAGPDSFRGAGIGDIMVTFSKLDTNSGSILTAEAGQRQ